MCRKPVGDITHTLFVLCTVSGVFQNFMTVNHVCFFVSLVYHCSRNKLYDQPSN